MPRFFLRSLALYKFYLYFCIVLYCEKEVNVADIESQLFLQGQLILDLTQFLHDVIPLCVQLVTVMMTVTQMLLHRQLPVTT